MIVLVGHAGHEEVEGTMGEAPEHFVLVETQEDVERLELEDPDRVAYLTQTTLSVAETQRIVARLRDRFPKAVGPKTDDICYATMNRQIAVTEMALAAFTTCRNSRSFARRFISCSRGRSAGQVRCRLPWVHYRKVPACKPLGK